MQRPGRTRRVTLAAVLLGAAITAVLALRGYHASAQQPVEPVSRGKAVYDSHCVECHGSTGKGDGPAALTLMPHPRDFTIGRYKIRTTETGSLPTDEDLIGSVKRGLPGSSMPGWEGLIPDGDIAAVVQSIKSLSPRFAAEVPEPIGPAPRPILIAYLETRRILPPSVE